LRFLYLLAVYLAAPIVSLVFLWRGLTDRSYWRNFRERFGFGPPLPAHGVWVHAVSAGEVQACAPLIGALHRRHPGVPLTVTTLTPTGAARARALFGNVAQVRYVPFDLPGAVRRFLRRAQPRLAVIVETELWPNLYRECARRRVPLVLASARLSVRSVGRYRRLGALFREALSQTAIIAAQAPADAERFRALGADPGTTHVTGNLKFDFELPEDIPERARRARERYAPGRPMWVAGSTHGGS
jgi:3-deoxy-D-manno-octulosonic-acid transferase